MNMYNMIDVIMNNCRQFSNKVAVIDNGHTYTYSEIGTMVITFANYLRKEANIKFQDRVCVYMDNGIEHVISFFSILAIGAIYVPIHHQMKSTQVEYIFQHCKANKIICSSHKNILCKKEDIIEFDLKMHSSCERLEYSKIISYDIAAIIYTSGSTGMPKGVVLSHQNIFLGAKIVSDYLNISYNDRILGLLPLSFDYGLNQLTSAFYKSSTIVFKKGVLINQIPRLIQEYSITGLAGVPPIWINLLEILKKDSYDLPSLRYITNSGGRIPHEYVKELKSRLKYAEIFLMYGLTESFRSTFLDPKLIYEKPNSIGKPIYDTEVYIIDSDNIECEPYQVGEIVTRGPLVSLGYWNDQEENVKVFKHNPLCNINLSIKDVVVYSGDMGYKDEEGYLFFVGRNNSIIKSCGFRTNPSQIEDVIYQLDCILECVVLGIENSNTGDDDIVAFLRVDSATEYKRIKNAVIEKCAKELPNYMIPNDVIVIDVMPKTASGKINFSKLNKEYKNLNSVKNMRL